MFYLLGYYTLFVDLLPAQNNSISFPYKHLSDFDSLLKWFFGAIVSHSYEDSYGPESRKEIMHKNAHN